MEKGYLVARNAVPGCPDPRDLRRPADPASAVRRSTFSMQFGTQAEEDQPGQPCPTFGIMRQFGVSKAAG